MCQPHNSCFVAPSPITCFLHSFFPFAVHPPSSLPLFAVRWLRGASSSHPQVSAGRGGGARCGLVSFAGGGGSAPTTVVQPGVLCTTPAYTPAPTLHPHPHSHHTHTDAVTHTPLYQHHHLVTVDNVCHVYVCVFPLHCECVVSCRLASCTRACIRHGGMFYFVIFVLGVCSEPVWPVLL
jgi:hypothetical protein